MATTRYGGEIFTLTATNGVTPCVKSSSLDTFFPRVHSMPTISFYCVICGTALQAPSDSLHDLMECHACTRYVPVPRPATVRGKFTSFQAVFPPKVLELSVTFD